jgi:hypothetical protein
VIDTDRFGKVARLCRQCSRVWPIDPAEAHLQPAAPTEGSGSSPLAFLSRLFNRPPRRAK